MKRMYFLVRDVPAAKRVVDELLLAHIDAHHIHVLAKRGTPLGDLPEANLLQKSDSCRLCSTASRSAAGWGFLVGLLGIALRLVSPPVAGA